MTELGLGDPNLSAEQLKSTLDQELVSMQTEDNNLFRLYGFILTTISRAFPTFSPEKYRTAATLSHYLLRQRCEVNRETYKPVTETAAIQASYEIYRQAGIRGTDSDKARYLLDAVLLEEPASLTDYERVYGPLEISGALGVFAVVFSAAQTNSPEPNSQDRLVV